MIKKTPLGLSISNHRFYPDHAYRQRDVPAVVWTAVTGALEIAFMIAATMRRRARQFSTAS